MNYKYLPKFLRHWRAKYFCSLGFHKKPDNYQKAYIMYVCYHCGSVVENKHFKYD